jgi:protein-disulfide isomerase
MSGPVESDETDLTRKQRREQAREQRKQLEEAEAASAVRRKRLTRLGIVGAVVIAIIVVILIATGGSGGTKKVVSGSKAANETAAAVNAVVGGIPQHGNVLGYPNAPVTLQYFGDLQCPVCKQFTLGALPPIIQRWVRTGKVKIEYRSFETATREPEEFKTQQIAALAAGMQAKMWHYIELFYHEQGEESSGYATESYLQNLAKQVPAFNLTKWSSDRNNPELAKQVASDAQAASTEGFTGTPSFLIAKTGSTPKKLEYTSLSDPTSFNQAIEEHLKH